MVVEYRQADDSIKVHGYMMSDGPLHTAKGRMVRGWHFKCFHVARKRAARGDAVTGRVLADSPTAYDMDHLVMSKDDLAALGLTEAQAQEQGTAYLSVKLARLRTIAENVGLGVGDALVQEAYLADQHGGPYSHEHTHRLDTYQLVAHLDYAHGVADARVLQSTGGLHAQHGELHARTHLEAIHADRVADADDQDRHRDWRTQYTVEIE